MQGKSPADSGAVAGCKPAARSKVSNQSATFLDGVDGRSALARRFRDVLAEIISDLGGHDAGLSEVQRQIARRIATIAVECERLEAQAMSGETIDLELYGRLADRLGRACQRLGIKRQARTVGLVDILEGRA
jgi:hypothetical protein